MRSTIGEVDLVAFGSIDPRAARMCLDFDPVSLDEPDPASDDWQRQWQARNDAAERRPAEDPPACGRD